MSDVGSGFGLNNVTLTFDDAAASNLPDDTQITAGTYKPTNFGGGDTFPPPAPVGPYSTLLSTFNGTDPTGDWSLYVVDDLDGLSGNIMGGWSLELTYELPSVTITDTLPAGFNLLDGSVPPGDM
jgi:hypothetical protein